MSRIFCSENSKYVGVASKEGLALYQSEVLVVKYPKPSIRIGRFLGLSNKGDFFFETDNNIYRYRTGRNSKLQRVANLLELEESPVKSKILKSQSSVVGDRLLYQKSYPVLSKEQGRRLFGFIPSSSGVEREVYQQELFLWSVGSTSQVNFVRVVTDEQEGEFHWAASKDLSMVVVAQKQGEQLHFQVISLAEEVVLSEFTMSYRNLSKLDIDSRGMILFAVEHSEGTKVFLYTLDQRRYAIFCPSGFRMVRFALEHIVFRSECNNRYLVKNFQDQVLLDIDVSFLKRMHDNYFINFRESSDVDILTINDEVVSVQHTEVSQLLTDAKRWEYTYRQKLYEKETQELESAKVFHETRREDLTQKELSEKLAFSVRSQEDSLETQGDYKGKDLLSLIEEEDYVEETYTPPTKVTLPGKLRLDVSEEREEPSSMEREAVGSSSTGAPKNLRLSLEAPQKGRPSVEEETRPPSTGAGGDRRLSLRRERERSTPEKSPSRREIELRLEKIRLSYVAGELMRDDYYRMKRELEAELEGLTDISKSNLQATPGPSLRGSNRLRLSPQKPSKPPEEHDTLFGDLEP